MVQTALSGLLVFFLLFSGGLGSLFDLLSPLGELTQIHEGEQTASILPPDTDVYLTINLRPGLSQLQQMRQVLSKWVDNPALKNQFEGLMGQLADSDIDIEQDVLPWLGPELALGVSHNPAYLMMGKGPLQVFIIGTGNRTKSDAFVFGKLFPYMTKGAWTPSGPTDSYEGIDTLYDPKYTNFYWAFTDEYIIISQTQYRLEWVLDLYLAGESGDSLADNADFQTVRANLPSERMGMAYVNIDHMLAGALAVPQTADGRAGILAMKPFLPSFAGGSVCFVDDGIKTDYYTPTPMAIPGVLATAAVVIPNVGRVIGQQAQAAPTPIEPPAIQSAVEAMTMDDNLTSIPVDAAGTVTQVTTRYPPAYPSVAANPLTSANLVPGSALGFFSTENLTSWWQWVKPIIAGNWAELRALSSDPTFPDSLDNWLVWIGDELGFDIEQDVLGWMNGETSFAMLPGTWSIPENIFKGMFLMIQVDDPAYVEGKLNTIVDAANTNLFKPGEPTISLVPITIGGRDVVSIEHPGFSSNGLSPCYAFFNVDTSHYLVFSFTQGTLSAAINAVNNPANSLAQSPSYQQMLTNLPATKNGLSYVNIRQLASLLLPLLPLDQILGGDGVYLAPMLLAPLQSWGSSAAVGDVTGGISGTSLLRVARVNTRAYLSPVKVQRQIGENFTVDIRLDEVWPGGSSNVSIAEFHLVFNSNQLEVVDADNITPGIQITPVFPAGTGTNYTITMNSANNASAPGVIDYAVTLHAPANFVPGTKPKVATITFYGKAAGESNIVMGLRLADSTNTTIPTMWQGSVVRLSRLPTILNTRASPSMIATYSMFKGGMGSDGTNLIVEAISNKETGGAGIGRVTANLRTLLFQMLPYSPVKIKLRTDLAPLNDLRVRQALSMALDRPVILSKFGLPDIVVNPGEELPVDYNPMRAKQLLYEAGYPNGFKTNIVTSMGQYPALASVIKDYWAKIGIDLEVKVVSQPELNTIASAMSYDQMMCWPSDLSIPADRQAEWVKWLSSMENWELWHVGYPQPYSSEWEKFLKEYGYLPPIPIPVPAPPSGGGGGGGGTPPSESVYRRYISLWELVGNLPWFLGESDLQHVMAKFKLGNFAVPVTVTDRWGNKVSSQIKLAIVDTMQPLTIGWNLFSTPVKLDDAYAKWADIFYLGDGLRASDAIRYDAASLSWVGVTPDYKLKPLEAIYVYAQANDQIGSIFARTPASPPMRDLAPGWNLVGPAVPPVDWNSMPVNEAMVTVEQDVNGLRGYSVVVSPGQQYSYGQDYLYKDSQGNVFNFGGYGWYFDQQPWVHTVGSSDSYDKTLRVGGGVWVFMEHPDLLAGFSTTPVLVVNEPTVPVPWTPEPGYDLGDVPRYNWERVTRNDFEEYHDGGNTKIFVKYVGYLSPSKVFEFYKQRMAELGWELSYWEGDIDSAYLYFLKDVYSETESGAYLTCQINVGAWGWYYGSYMQEINIQYERSEPGVDLSDLPRFNWQPVVMTFYNQFSDDSGTHTWLWYQGKVDPASACKFYMEVAWKFGWQIVSSEFKSDSASLVLKYTKDGKTCMAFIGAQAGIIKIEHHKFLGTAPSVFYGKAYIDAAPVDPGLPLHAIVTSLGWSTMTSGTGDGLYGVWGSSGKDVFAVGDAGTIVRFDGKNWSLMDSGTSANLSGVWGSGGYAAGYDVFAVGDWGTILRYDGSTWSPMTSGTEYETDLYCVWGSAWNDVFVVGDNSSGMSPILHYDGSTWSTMTSGTEYAIEAVWGSSGKDVFAVGDFGTILHYDGSTWSLMTTGIPTDVDLKDVWGSAWNDVFAVGEYGTIFHYDGSSWSLMSCDSTSFFHDVWGSSGKDVFAVGDNGTILHYNGTIWSLMGSGATTMPLQGIWGSSGSDVFAVGSVGTILHYGLQEVWETSTYTGNFTGFLSSVIPLPGYSYLIMVPPDNPLTPEKDGGREGDTIIFKIDVPAEEKTYTIRERPKWNSGSIKNQQLTARTGPRLYETWMAAEYEMAMADTWFFDAVSGNTSGRINFNRSYQGPVASADLFSATSSGMIDASLISLTQFEKQVPLSQGLTLSYLTGKPDALALAARDVYNDFTPLWDEWEYRNNVKVLHFLPGDTLVLITKKPVSGVADLAGLRIRSFGTWQMDTIRRLGAIPVALSISDTYAFLQKGAIDGALLPFSAVWRWQLFQVAPYLTETGIGTGSVYATVVNRNYWNGLSPDDRSLMEGLSDEVLNYYLQKVTEANQAAIDEMVPAGVHFNTWSPSEQALAKSAVQPAQTTAWVAPIGGAAQDLINRLRENLAIYEPLSTYQSWFEMWQAQYGGS